MKKKLADQVESQLAKLTKMVGTTANRADGWHGKRWRVDQHLRRRPILPRRLELKPESAVLLARIATALVPMPNDVRVEGNTDSQVQPQMSNWTLSAMRAVSIVEFLSSNGIKPSRLQAEGLGQYHPETSNATPEGRAKNRHADIMVLYPQT